MKKPKRKIAVAALAGLAGGCAGPQSRAVDVPQDGGPDAAVDTDTEDDTDTDTDIDTDSNSDVDTDTGGCSGVVCYEDVGPAADDLGLQGLVEPGVLPGDRDVLTGSFSRRYASEVCFRVVDLSGVELAAGDLAWTEDVEGDAVFEIALPDSARGIPYRLFLYGTSLENVRLYDAFPARRYVSSGDSEDV